jgi:hypothetical protein
MVNKGKAPRAIAYLLKRKRQKTTAFLASFVGPGNIATHHAS